jgi:hypothetical protein
MTSCCCRGGVERLAVSAIWEMTPQAEVPLLLMRKYSAVGLTPYTRLGACVLLLLLQGWC